MARQKVIKRVYKEGRERTVSSARRPRAAVARKPTERPKLAQVSKLETEKRITLVDDYQLPPHYDTTRLVLMAKDPYWIYAYWEIAPASIANLKNKIGYEAEQARITLRMYDITFIEFNGKNANSYFDIEVGPYTNSWYINLWSDNVSFCADIGVKTASGEFYTLARSNYIQTPRASYSPRTEQIWMRVSDKTQEPAYIESRVKPTKIQYPSAPQQYYPSKKKKIYLTEEDLRNYYAKLTPLLRDIISARLARLYGRRPYVLEGESDEERKAVYSRLPKYSFLKKIILGSSESLLLPGASEQLLQQAGASEFMQEKMLDRKFFFEIGTELIVYGRTEPDAEVWLKDKKIPLRADGTFTLRFALPEDGKIPLEFKAISKDKKQQRNITTVIERKTNKD